MALVYNLGKYALVDVFPVQTCIAITGRPALRVGERVATEMIEREKRGEPELTDMQQLAAIKRGSELVIAERAAKEAGQAEVIDVPPIEQAETD